MFDSHVVAPVLVGRDLRGERWQPVCSCGARSGMFPSKRAAEVAGQEHARRAETRQTEGAKW